VTAEEWADISCSVGIDLTEGNYEGSALRWFRGSYPAATADDVEALVAMEQTLGVGLVEVSPAENGTRLVRLRYGGVAEWTHPVTSSTYYVILAAPLTFSLQPTSPRTWAVSFYLIEAPGSFS
jgi:hypothetical protein